MKRATILLLLSVICFGQDEKKVEGQKNDDPIKFRGAFIGEPLSDFVNCSGKAKSLKPGYKLHGDLCGGKKGMLIHVHEKGILEPKDEGERFLFDNAALYKIQIFIPNDDWSKIRFDLTQKLGDPVSEVPQTYQNGFGAKWEYDQGFWVHDDIVAFAGIRVLPVRDPLGHGLANTGIRITITTAERAKLPSTTPSTLD